jgi:hypothetical protein
VIFVVALVGASIWVWRTLSPDAVAARLSGMLGREVQVRALHVHFTPWPRLGLEEVRVAPDVEIESVKVALRPLALLRLRAEPARFELVRPRFTLVRGADGVFSVGEGADADEEPASAPRGRLAALPEIEVDSATIDFIDRAVASDLPSTRFFVERLTLDHSLFGAEHVRAQIRAGPEGESGTLRVDATIEPLEGTDLWNASLELDAAIDDLDAELLLPYLPERWAVSQAEGRVGAKLSARGSRAAGIEADIALDLPGALGTSDLELSGSSRVEAHLSWRGGEWVLRDGRLRAAGATLEGHRASDLDVAFGYARGTLEIESLGLDTLRGSVGQSADLEGGVRWDLDVEHTGKIALSGTPELRGFVFGLSAAEARDAELTLTAPGGARLRIHLDRLTLRDFAEGARANLAIEASLGDAGTQGRLWLSADTDTLPSDPDLDALPILLESRSKAVDASLLVPFLPVQWNGGATNARLEGEAKLAGAMATGFRGPVEFRLSAGVLTLAGIEMEAPALLSGPAVIGAGALGLSPGRLEAARATFRGHAVGGARANFTFGDDRLTITSLDVAGYDGRWTVTDAGAGWPELEVHVTHAQRISLYGAPRPWPGAQALRMQLPSKASARDVEGTVRDRARADAPTVSVRVERLEATDSAPDAAVSLAFSATLGERGEQGRLEGNARIGPRVAAHLPLAVHATAKQLDPTLVLLYLPDRWRTGGEPGPIDARVDVTRDDGTGFEGELALEMARGALDAAGVRLGAPVVLRGPFAVREGGIAFPGGQLEAARAELRGFRAEAVRAQLALESGTLSARPLAFRAYGGTWSQTGSITSDNPPVFQVDATVSGVDLGQLISLGVEIEPAPEPTRLRGEATLRGRWTGGQRWLDSIEGSGSLDLRGGSMPGTGLLQAVGKALVRRVPGVSWAPASVGSVDRTPLESARIPFRVEDGALHTDDFQIATGDYGFVGQGRLSQDLDLYLTGEVSLAAQGVSKVLTLGAIPTGVRRGLRLPAIPIEARGPLDSVSFRANVSGVPLATVKGLLGLPSRALDLGKGAAGAVRDIGGRAIGRPPPGKEPDTLD